MSTSPDIIINSDEWYDLRNLSGIATNKIIIQNKGNSELLISYNSNLAQNSREGFILTHAQFIKTDALNVNVKSLGGAGTIYIEEVV